MRFRFCPVCGNPLTLREAGDDGLTPYCVSCRKMWFDMFLFLAISRRVNRQKRQRFVKSGKNWGLRLKNWNPQAHTGFRSGSS